MFYIVGQKKQTTTWHKNNVSDWFSGRSRSRDLKQRFWLVLMGRIPRNTLISQPIKIHFTGWYDVMWPVGLFIIPGVSRPVFSEDNIKQRFWLVLKANSLEFPDLSTNQNSASFGPNSASIRYQLTQAHENSHRLMKSHRLIKSSHRLIGAHFFETLLAHKAHLMKHIGSYELI